jgi:hypothetical protein
MEKCLRLRRKPFIRAELAIMCLRTRNEPAELHFLPERRLPFGQNENRSVFSVPLWLEHKVGIAHRSNCLFYLLPM